jgi:hypothetical protein
MRKLVVAVLSAIVVGLMLVPSGVSAGTKMLVIPDRIGDLSKMYYSDTGEPRNGWGDNAPIVLAGYFDITSVWLVQKGKTYALGMGLAGNLPKVGDALPPGISSAHWDLYIESAPWDPANPAPFLFVIRLAYDGSSYSSNLLDRGAGVTTPLPLTLDGSEFEMTFSADAVGSLSGSWVSFGVMVFWGAGGYFNVDNPDPGAVPGLNYWDFPWPFA